MDSNAFIWIDVVAAASLALWFAVNRPEVGPRAFRPALAIFAVGQAIPSLGLLLVRPAATLPHGIELVLVGIVLPAFVVMFVTTVWLIRAVTNPAGGAHGGQRRLSPAATRDP